MAADLRGINTAVFAAGVSGFPNIESDLKSRDHPTSYHTHINTHTYTNKHTHTNTSYSRRYIRLFPLHVEEHTISCATRRVAVKPVGQLFTADPLC